MSLFPVFTFWARVWIVMPLLVLLFGCFLNLIISLIGVSENVNRYVRPEDQERKPFIDGATGGENLKTAFDACEITDMLKQQNIYIERDLVELGEDIGHGKFLDVKSVRKTGKFK